MWKYLLDTNQNKNSSKWSSNDYCKGTLHNNYMMPMQISPGFITIMCSCAGHVCILLFFFLMENSTFFTFTNQKIHHQKYLDYESIAATCNVMMLQWILKLTVLLPLFHLGAWFWAWQPFHHPCHYHFLFLLIYSSLCFFPFFFLRHVPLDHGPSFSCAFYVFSCASFWVKWKMTLWKKLMLVEDYHSY